MTLASQMASDLEAIFTTSEFGEAITYTPANGTTPAFSAVGIFQRTQYDELDTRVIRDLVECRILHSALTAKSLTAPATRFEHTKGDKITRGSDIWEIAEAHYDSGLWILTLEKNIRITPA